MVRARATAAPASLLLLLCSLGGADTGPAGEPGPDAQVPVLSKNKIKSMIKLLNHRIQVLHQKNMMHEHKLSEKQNEVLSAPVNITNVKGSSVKTLLLPSGVQIDVQEMPSSNSDAAHVSNTSSMLIINKLQKIFPNIFLETQTKYKQVGNEKNEEGKKKRWLYPDLEQDTGNNKNRLTRTNITIRFHSKDNSSQTQIDIYNLKHSRANPEVHIVASNIVDQQNKINSVVVQDDVLQVTVNNSLVKKIQDNKKVRRKSFAEIEAGNVERNSTDSNRKKLLIEDVPESATYPWRQLNHILKTLEDQMSVQRYDFQGIKGSHSQVPVRMLKNVLQDLQKEYKTQMPLSSNEIMNSSVMENILQNLKNHKEKSESRVKENKTQTPFQGHSRSLQVSDENIEQSTPMPEPTSVRAKTNMKNAQRYEFFKEHEGIHDKKKAKAADLKGLLKHIIIACVAVTGLILAVIVFMHIFTSIFVKNKQEPVITNTYNIYKREDLTKDKAKTIPEIDCKGLKEDTTVVKNHSEHSNWNQLPVHLSTEESKKQGKDLEPSEKQPGHNPTSMNSPSKRTDEKNIIPLASKCKHSSQMPPANCSSSEIKTCKNHKPRTLKTNQCCHKSRHCYTNPKEHGYKRLKDKDLALHRKHLNHQRSSRHDKHRSRFKKCHATHSNCSFQDGCYSNSSPSDDSSSDVYKSEISQHDGSKCTCSQHRMGSCSSDSYFD
ncbi:uncharacterized protein LOC102445872 isoform X2 [Pelodiscus sinensis]|uniref:uncharacterized protein LOC102445872 isoform X2 n=1 Tax=Pelodiscus sinensis TaxID=13735 RepID=UPI000D71F9DC|nr:uncharacterized protein LOC102445872 isoform X2 [Pelodiscus sinensis]|eukprot:XP_025035203.1 uncharacterized protein LOC102445872 isoform X2 [Pelodiscus sinensis]